MLLLRLSTNYHTPFNAFLVFVVHHTDFLTINSKAVEKYKPQMKVNAVIYGIII